MKEKVEQTEKVTKTKKNKKKVIIIVIIILILIAIVGAVAGFLYYHGQQFALLHIELMNNLNAEIIEEDGTLNPNAKIDMEIKTTGNYAIVEKTMKEYLNSLVEIGKNIENVCDEEKIQNMLEIDNIKSDGPDFVKTKQEINQMKQQITEYIDEMIKLCDRNEVVSAIDDKDINDFYKEVYRKLVGDEEVWSGFEQQIEELEEAKKEINLTLDSINDILQYLSDNKNSWTISGGQILFYSQEKLDEYTEIVNRMLDI